MVYRHRDAFIFAIALLLNSVAFVGCADSELDEGAAAPAPLAEIPGNTGKADGISYSIKDYFLSTERLPIDDLTDRLATIATDGLNSALGSVPYVDIKLSDTQLFGLQGGTEGGSTITDLNDLVSGLSAEYGETGFVTKLNELRRSFLSNSNYGYFAESEFSIGLNGDTSFSTDAGDVDVRVGFSPTAQISARTVFAHEGNLGAVLNSPLQSAAELRGFILPRDTDDLRNLLPGESVLLSGEGVLAFNFGANLPIFSTSPIDHLVLTARFHLGARVRTSGEIDIQFIRGDGDDLFVDVGVKNARDRRFRVAFERGLGLQGVPPLIEVALGDRVYKLGEIAESLVESRLNRSSLLDFGIEGVSGNSSERLSVQRFQVDLNTNTTALDQALKQIAGGDLRLMQTLADRQSSGVTEILSLERGMKEKFRHLGAHIASMRFFSQRTERNGKFVVRNGEQVEEVLFRELDERSGRFWTDWGFRRQVLTSQTWQGGAYLGATSNLRLAVTESDSFTKRDQILDHVDTALLSVLDFETAYVNLTRQYEELQHEVDIHCDDCDDHEEPGCDRQYRRCLEERVTDQQVEEWRQRLNESTDRALNSLDSQGYQSQFSGRQEIARQLLALKLHLSSVKEIPAALADVTGRTSILSDVRLTQAGLDGMFRTVSPDDFETRMRQMLTMIVSKRSRDYDRKYDRALNWLDGEQGKIDDMVQVYRRAQDRYNLIDDSSRIGIGGDRLGDGAFVIGNWGEEQSHTPSMLTIAEQKSLIAANMVEDLVDEGSRLSLIQALVRLVTLGLADTRGFESHHLASYTIASLVSPEHREWLISMDFEEPVFSDVRVYSRGVEEDGFISAGEFDLEQLTSR